jgi:cytochrome c oxidase subunit 2
VADESYLRESILVPARKVRAGWRPIMPPYEGQVSEEDMVRLIAFLKGLRRPGDYPPQVQEAEPPEAREKGKGKEKEKAVGKDKGKGK